MANCSQINNTTIKGTSAVTYDSTQLPCTDVNTCDGLNIILAKFDSVICSVTANVAILTEEVMNLTEDVMIITEDIIAINDQIDICCSTTTTSTTIVPTTTTTSSSSTSTSTTTVVPPTTTSTTTVCTRPTGLINKTFYYSYQFNDGPYVNFTATQELACAAAQNVGDPSYSFVGSAGQVSSFIVGATVYSGISTNCQKYNDGFFITDLSTKEVTHIVSGVIVSIEICASPTTTTTTTVAPTTTTTTIAPTTTTTTTVASGPIEQYMTLFGNDDSNAACASIIAGLDLTTTRYSVNLYMQPGDILYDGPGLTNPTSSPVSTYYGYRPGGQVAFTSWIYVDTNGVVLSSGYC